jgi:demethylmenaquinone methyltransferase/2-methoxy-6-polyprenyl-1,4-benzoquinol methylase
MFDNIALRYDFLNHFFSFGIDVLWRKRLIRILKTYGPVKVLDMASGTGDLAVMAAKLGIEEVVGVDLSPNMAALGNEKIHKNKLDKRARILVGDAEVINFDNDTFDAAMVAFGVRNFEDLGMGLLEMNRVIKPGKPLLVLEFSKPRNVLIRTFYNFYSFRVIPFFGKLISKDKRAYEYLPESIREFPEGGAFIKRMEECNFINCEATRLSFGIATIYKGIKSK